MKWILVIAYMHLVPAHPNSTDFSKVQELTMAKLDRVFTTENDCKIYGDIVTSGFADDMQLPDVVYRCYKITE